MLGLKVSGNRDTNLLAAIYSISYYQHLADQFWYTVERVQKKFA
jgi:hypothetical protein